MKIEEKKLSELQRRFAQLSDQELSDLIEFSYFYLNGDPPAAVGPGFKRRFDALMVKVCHIEEGEG